MNSKRAPLKSSTPMAPDVRRIWNRNVGRVRVPDHAAETGELFGSWCFARAMIARIEGKLSETLKTEAQLRGMIKHFHIAALRFGNKLGLKPKLRLVRRRGRR